MERPTVTVLGLPEPRPVTTSVPLVHDLTQVESLEMAFDSVPPSFPPQASSFHLRPTSCPANSTPSQAPSLLTQAGFLASSLSSCNHPQFRAFLQGFQTLLFMPTSSQSSTPVSALYTLQITKILVRDITLPILDHGSPHAAFWNPIIALPEAPPQVSHLSQ